MALFLRRLVSDAGLTLEQLEAATGLKRSTIGNRLAAEGMTGEFIAGVVRACTETPPMSSRRDEHLSTAARLWQRAQTGRTPPLSTEGRPPAVREAVSVAQDLAIESQAALIATQQKLIIKQEELALTERSRDKAMTAWKSASHLALELAVCVRVLATEIDNLTLARDNAVEAVPPDPVGAEAIAAALESTVIRHRRGQRELRDAENQIVRARDVLAEAITRARQLNEAIRQLAATTESGSTGSSATSVVLVDDPSAESPDMLQVDLALDRAEAASRAIDDQIEEAIADLQGPTAIAARPSHETSAVRRIVPRPGSFAQRLNKLFETVHPPGRRAHTNAEVAAACVASGYLISKPYLQELRSGQRTNPSDEAVAGLARFFKVKPDYFFNDIYAAKIDHDLEHLSQLQGYGLRRLSSRVFDLSEESQNLLTSMAEKLRESESLPAIPD